MRTKRIFHQHNDAGKTAMEVLSGYILTDHTELLNVIRCNYKLSTKTPCVANNCSCRKNGLPCATTYGNCHGSNCTNVLKLDFMDNSEDESFEKNDFKQFDI